MVKEPGTGPGLSGSAARATEASSAHSASGTRKRARLTREADLTWMLIGAELPTRAASQVGVRSITVVSRARCSRAPDGRGARLLWSPAGRRGELAYVPASSLFRRPHNQPSRSKV